MAFRAVCRKALSLRTIPCQRIAPRITTTNKIFRATFSSDDSSDPPDSTKDIIDQILSDHPEITTFDENTTNETHDELTLSDDISTEPTTTETDEELTLSEDMSDLLDQMFSLPETTTAPPPIEYLHPDSREYFEQLLDNSPLMQMESFKDEVLIGKISDIVNDDLYIDYGGKFYFVAQRPKKEGDAYQKGTRVLMKLTQYEVTGKFHGEQRALTINESDGFLIGLYRPRGKNVQNRRRISSES